MPHFGTASSERLSTCDERLQRVFTEAIKIFDFVVLCGFRGEAEQNQAFAEGKSKVKWPNGKHNPFPSKATDVAPYPIDWHDKERFYFLAGIVMGITSKMGIPLRWGGDWDQDGEFKDETFSDIGHFEIVE